MGIDPCGLKILHQPLQSKAHFGLGSETQVAFSVILEVKTMSVIRSYHYPLILIAGRPVTGKSSGNSRGDDIHHSEKASGVKH
jgi:predicted sugar kinase